MAVSREVEAIVIVAAEARIVLAEAIAIVAAEARIVLAEAAPPLLRVEVVALHQAVVVLHLAQAEEVVEAEAQDSKMLPPTERSRNGQK